MNGESQVSEARRRELLQSGFLEPQQSLRPMSTSASDFNYYLGEVLARGPKSPKSPVCEFFKQSGSGAGPCVA